MRVHNDFTTYNPINPVVTVGAFDGVHLGHLEILKRLKQIAAETSGETVVVSFWPHPRHVLNAHLSLKLLNTPSEKNVLLKNASIDHLVIIPFDSNFSDLSSDQFIKNYLVERLKVKNILMGYNHHFGKDREGNIDLIRQYSVEYGFRVNQIPPHIIENEKISSTKIRHAIANGAIDFANKLLGYHYMITGEVVEGQKLGREIGFPTANIRIDEEYKLIPQDGVYAVKVSVNNAIYKGMLNIGYRPTVNANNVSKTLEVHILDFDEEIYNQQITIEFAAKIRDEIKFPDLNALKAQLEIDKRVTWDIISLE